MMSGGLGGAAAWVHSAPGRKRVTVAAAVAAVDAVVVAVVDVVVLVGVVVVVKRAAAAPLRPGPAVAPLTAPPLRILDA